MERFKRIGRKFLFPPLAVVLVSVPVSAALLSYVFMTGREESAIAYPIFALSAYALTILCAWIVKSAGAVKTWVRTAIHSHTLTHRYFSDDSFKMHVSLYLSLGVNLLYAVMKLFYGAYYRSVWFGTLAVYYILLAVMRFLLLRHVSRAHIGVDPVLELKSYRLCGIILMLMNIALTGVVVLVVHKNEGFEYAGYLIYVMAMYAFYNVIMAARNLLKYRKYGSPVMSAAKVISLAAALVSMLSLETAMLTQFGDREDPEIFRKVMTGTTGGCVCLLVLGMAAYMIVRSTRELRRQK